MDYPRYRAIFFDWDGTAVTGRNSPSALLLERMDALLQQGVYLMIISGTTYKNICRGELHTCLSPRALSHLYLGLGRGAYNFGFTPRGEFRHLTDPDIGHKAVLGIHDVSYQIHRHLYETYGYQTDIVFDRPNYCKIDIMNSVNRSESLYLSGNEIEDANRTLRGIGFSGGLKGLISLAEEIGTANGVPIKATCDAKYLEVGTTTKADNVNTLLHKVLAPAGIESGSCAFWGDEYLALDDGIWGSDAAMITSQSKEGDFFDVGSIPGPRPEKVIHLGGGIHTFLSFLADQQLR